MPIPIKLRSIVDDLAFFTDRTERIQALIELGEEFKNPATDEVLRTAESRVPGCESEVFVAQLDSDHGAHFRFAVDNPQGISAMAMARVLELGLEGASPEEIKDVPDDLIYEIFGRELSMGKSLGLTGMIRMVKALSYNHK